MAYSFDDADARRSGTTTQYFEMFVQPRASTTRAGPRSRGTRTPWVIAPSCPPFDDDVWELYDTRRLDPGPRPRRRAARQARRAAAAVPDRGGQVQRAPARRPPRRALQPRPRRPAAADPGQHASSCSAAWAGCPRTRSLNIKNKSHAVTAEIDVPDGRRDGRDRRPGRQHRRLEPVRARRRPKYCYNLFGIAAVQRRRRRRRCPPATTRCAWSSPTTAAASARAAPSTLYVDGDQGRRGPGRRDRADDLLRRRDHATSAATPARRSRDDYAPERQPRSPARSTGSQIDIGEAPRTTTT